MTATCKGTFVAAKPGHPAYHRLALGAGPDPDDRGRWIPTSGVEQYGATLATWFGVPSGSLSTVFPLIGNFATQSLGFMGPGGPSC